MNNTMAQYKDLFVQTAQEYLTALNDGLLQLEKNSSDLDAIDAVFRAAHSLKGQSAAMGYGQTGYLCHVIEDAFYEIKVNRRSVDPELADLIFRALDSLSESVAHIETDSTELPLSDIADQLKQVAGLQTVGSGHSNHDQTPAATTLPMTVLSPVSTVTENSASPTTTDKPKRGNYIKTVPVKVEQLDDIVGSLEELMVNRLTMRALVQKSNDPALIQAQEKNDGLIELLQFQIMKIRTVPLSLILEHIPRVVRDLGRMLNKQIELRIVGGDLELDRTVVEQLNEPLTHLLRNAADHGVAASGIITIETHAERDSAIMSVTNDGPGIDWGAVAKKAGVDPEDKDALTKALFSGISTTQEVSLISGRGIGLAAVKRTIEDIGGTISVKSVAGHGATFILRLPLNVSVVRTLVVRVKDHRYAIAAASIDHSLRLEPHKIVTNLGQEVFRHEDHEIPLIRLRPLFGLADEKDTPAAIYAVILNVDSERIAVAVDEISETIETVIRPLPRLLESSHMFSGVAVVGDGSSVLLINPRGLSNA